MPEIDHKNTHEIFCPWCGIVQVEYWRQFGVFEDELSDCECQHCGKKFTATRDVTVAYSTSRNKCEGECNYILRDDKEKSHIRSHYIYRSKNWTIWRCTECHDDKILTGPVAENNEPYVIPLPEVKELLPTYRGPHFGV